MIRIGVIVAQNSLKELYPIKEKFKGRCEIHFFTYEKTSQIKQLYEKNILIYDAIVVNWLAYHLIKKLNISFSKPTYYYLLNERDIYKKLFEIALKYKNLDFSRVLLDYNILGNVILNGNIGELFSIYKQNIEANLSNVEQIDHFYQNLLENHKSMHQTGNADFSITMFSNIFDDLVAEGIQAEFVTVSIETIAQLFDKIIIEVSHQQLLDSTIVVGKLSSDAFISDEFQGNAGYNLSLACTLLHDFSKRHHYSMVIHQQSTFFELFISKKELEQITNEYTFDTLAQFLNESLLFEVYIGWGIGSNLDEVRKKAYLANHEAYIQKKSSMIIDYQNQLIEVTGQTSPEPVLLKESPELKELSKRLNISLLNLKKILTVIQKSKTDEITSEDIALHLGITTRSANRILNELENKKIAEYLYTKHEKQRGRPKKVFKIKLNEF